MKTEKRQRLEAQGWKIGSVEDFLDLSEEEIAFIKLKREKKMKLKPPKNYRLTDRRCCANCKHWVFDSSSIGSFPAHLDRDDGIGIWICERDPERIAGDWDVLRPEFHICDRYTRKDSLKSPKTSLPNIG